MWTVWLRKGVCQIRSICFWKTKYIFVFIFSIFTPHVPLVFFDFVSRQAHASTSVTCSKQIATIFTTENILAWLVFLAERSKLILLQARWNVKERRKVALGKKDILPVKKLLRTKNLLLKRILHPKRKKVLKKPHHRLAILTFHENYELKFDQNFKNDCNFAILLFQVFLIFHHDLTKTPILNQTVRIKTGCFFLDYFRYPHHLFSDTHLWTL